MAQIIEYHPVSFELPASSPLRREFYKRRSHIPGVGALDESDYEGFDRQTLLYDMAIDRAGRTLLGFAPPMVNLAAELLPILAEARRSEDHRWTRLRLRRLRRFRHEQWELPLPRRWGSVDSLEVRLRFANGLEFEARVERLQLRPVFQQWSTLQKDNPLEWIDDWMTYAADQGAERVLLYDNGSAYAAGLVEHCSRIPVEVEVVVIPWDFPFGPPRSHYNNFAQAAQLNHASRVLGACTWQGFLDLDEYPVAPGGLERLLRAQPRHRGLLRLDNYLVPAIEGEVKSGQLPRARDFRHRALAPRGKGHKCFSRPEGLREARTHNGRCRLGYVRRAIPIEEAYFLHFDRLTTGWKGQRGADRPFDPALHVRSTAVQAAFSELEPQASRDAALSAIPPSMARVDAP
jgi:hypothetical protein